MLRQISVPSFVSVSAMALAILLPAAALGQTKVKVSVDTGKVLNPLTSRSLGVGLDGYDGNATNAQTAQLLHYAGVYTLRYPGNGGLSGIYHFTLPSGVINPYKEGKAPYFAPSNDFAALAAFFDSFGSAMVSVDYGSNLDGSGGGERTEAAAWVAYANGDPTSTQAIGKDSKGNDWKTVGYWAGLRAANPVTPDDGYNALRIGHPKPIEIQLWQIGNDAWNNGYYGPDHAAEFDLRAGPIPSAMDAGKRQGNARIGPTAYAEGFLAFAKAMKAVDPKILVGASFTTPTTNVSWMHTSSIGTSSASDLTGQSASAISWGGDWDSDLLKAACGEIDFGALSLVESPTLPPDYKVLDEEALLQSLGKDYNGIVTDLLERFRKDCPAGHTPRLAFTNFGASAQTIPHPGVVALFAADGAATLIETGSLQHRLDKLSQFAVHRRGQQRGQRISATRWCISWPISRETPSFNASRARVCWRRTPPSGGMAATDCCWSRAGWRCSAARSSATEAAGCIRRGRARRTPTPGRARAARGGPG